MGELKGFADALWIGGVNSLLEPGALQQGEYQWGINTTNRGGLISTRPGFSLVGQMSWGLGEPQGMTVFTPARESHSDYCCSWGQHSFLGRSV